MSSAIRIEILTSMDAVPPDEWGELVAASQCDSIFSTWAWLKAWSESLGSGRNLTVALAYSNAQLVGALALEERDGVLRFAGHERRDYCDVLLRECLGEAQSKETLSHLLEAAADACPRFRSFRLTRIPQTSPLLDAGRLRPGFYPTARRGVVAPCMDMATVNEKIRKKSLRRHTNRLAKLGELTYDTQTSAEAIAAGLEAFFDQHVRRWQDTPSPSLFLNPENREFYRALTARLGDSGSLRFSSVRLDGQLVAAHYGFLHSGTFTWYKPTFEPAFAKYSPGEVLIRYLMEMARDEDARLFDFTIGAESFKMRFATETPYVYDLHLTRSLLMAGLDRARLRLAGLRRR